MSAFRRVPIPGQFRKHVQVWSWALAAAQAVNANLEQGVFQLASARPITNQEVVRGHGSAGHLQGSVVTIDDSGNVRLNNGLLIGVAHNKFFGPGDFLLGSGAESDAGGSAKLPFVAFQDTGGDVFVSTSFACPTEWVGKSTGLRFQHSTDGTDTTNTYRLSTWIIAYRTDDDPESSGTLLRASAFNYAATPSRQLKEHDLRTLSGTAIPANCKTLSFIMARNSGHAGDTNTGKIRLHGLEIVVGTA